MTRRFKWLTPILILSLLFMSLLPCIGCTPGQMLNLLIWGFCAAEVYLEGDYQGTLEYMDEWKACVLELTDIVEGIEYLLDFVIPAEALVQTASAHGMQLTATQASELPDITLTYHGFIAHGGRYEMSLYDVDIDWGEASFAQNGNKSCLGSIVVEASSEPFEPHPLIYPAISCDPSSFTVMLNPDTACSNTMRIGNQGDATLTYDLYDVSGAVLDELIYDDGDSNTSTGWNYIGAKDAVRFTPPSYPAVLNTARICLNESWDDSGHEQFAVEVYDDNGAGGAPGTLLGTVYATATGWGWWDVDISSLGITITDGDFYIAYCQLGACPECEMLCIDTGPAHGRSWTWNYEGGVWSWHVITYENHMIRCVVEVPEDCLWLDENPKSGSVEPGNWDDITITIDASGLAPGDYSAEMVISNNDPDKGPITVPVTLLVNNPPSTLSSPVPANHAAHVPINVDFSWIGGDPDASDAVTYDVYLGTSSPPPLKDTIGPYPATQTSIAYDPGPLAYETSYHWEIVATDNHAVSAMGPVWDFTTEPGEWDPWSYDEDDSGFIEIGELLQAINDYIGGDIAISQLLDVIDLYIRHTPKP